MRIYERKELTKEEEKDVETSQKKLMMYMVMSYALIMTSAETGIVIPISLWATIPCMAVFFALFGRWLVIRWKINTRALHFTRWRGEEENDEE